MGYNLLINGVYWGYNPLILTIDPNFQRDIQEEAVGPSSTETASWHVASGIHFGNSHSTAVGNERRMWPIPIGSMGREYLPSHFPLNVAMFHLM